MCGPMWTVFLLMMSNTCKTDHRDELRSLMMGRYR